MIRIECMCLFDITETGVTGHYRESLLPFLDKSNTNITSQQAWYTSRNKQRNLETVIQLLSMRTHVSSFTRPIFHDGAWSFEVDMESESALSTFEDPLGTLKNDSIGVPIILGLNEVSKLKPEMICSGDSQNIRFTIIPINNI